MGAFKYRFRRYASLIGLPPSQCAEAPAVTSLQTLESVFWARGDEIVSLLK
jgi:hypothetical protein